MQVEIIILAILIFVVMSYNGQVSIKEFISDNFFIFRKLKEEDWDFYVRAKYGDNANADNIFIKRIRNGLIVMVISLFFFIKDLDALKMLISVVLGFLVYKIDYFDIKSYYKRHIFAIDSMLPHYLKSIEILIQHYTVPVAIGKSVLDAPDIFKDGLQEMINEINAGNDTIDPYMNFARKYPVRDSMRMMRLLYRLSIGSQDRKQEQMIMFSRTISSLQQKARETKYKSRLDKMEGKTMSMLISTGFGVMILLVLAVVQMMNI
jgi:hypothetical protein